MVFITAVNLARISRYVRPKLKDLYNRRMAQGPESYKHPSVWNNWNFDAEIFAFQNKLVENFDRNDLLKALEDRTFKGVGDSNSNLADEGRDLVKNHLLKITSNIFPKLPEFWVENIVESLMTETHLANSACKIGLKDLVLYKPITHAPNNRMLTDAFLSLVSIIERNKNNTEIFIRDIIGHALYDKDMTEDPFCPDVILNDPFYYYKNTFCTKDDTLEYRLIDQSAMNTVLACYSVGLFKNKVCIGQGPGETLDIAMDQAAIDAIRNIFQLDDGRSKMFAFQIRK